MPKRSRDRDPFFQLPRTGAVTSEGEVQVPLLFFDAAMCLGLFLVDHATAQAMVEAEGLDAVRAVGGSAVATIAFYEYRDASLGACNEVAVTIGVVPRGTRVPRLPALELLRRVDRATVGFYILDLPVTTPVSSAAGRELWGFPKFVTNVRFALESNHFRGGVADPDGAGDILTMVGNSGAGIPTPLPDLVLYSRLHDTLARSLVNMRGGGRVALPGSMTLSIGPSTHPMAERLRALGLAGATPAVVMQAGSVKMRLGAANS